MYFRLYNSIAIQLDEVSDSSADRARCEAAKAEVLVADETGMVQA